MSRIKFRAQAILYGLSTFWCASLVFSMMVATLRPTADEVGIPSTGDPGVTETVSEIMGRQKNVPLQSYLKPGQSDEGRLLPDRKNFPKDPASPRVAQHPPSGKAGSPAPSIDAPLITAQSVGVSFLGAQISESGFIPPDSMGAVGPSQILVCVNGRIKVFDKTGVLGALNTTTL